MAEKDDGVGPLLPVSRFLEKTLSFGGIDHGSIADESFTKERNVAETLFVRARPRAKLYPVHLEIHGAGHTCGQQCLTCCAGLVGRVEFIGEAGILDLAQSKVSRKTARCQDDGLPGLDIGGLP